MSWVKLDDRIFDNPKIAALSDTAKVAYFKAITYCARELTDGFVPQGLAVEYSRRAAVLKELTPGLWEPAKGGYRVHDYLKYNPTREQVQAERAAAQRRMFDRRSGERSPEHQPELRPEVHPEVRPPPVSRIPYPVDPVTENPTPEPFGGGSVLRKRWEEKIGPLGTRDGEAFALWERTVPDTWILEAMDEAESAERPYRYFAATLKRCVADGESPKATKRKAAKPGTAREQLLQRLAGPSARV